MGLFDSKTRYEEGRDARKTDNAGVALYLVGSLICVPMYFMIGAIGAQHVPPAIASWVPLASAVGMGLVVPIWASRRLASLFNFLSFRADEKATGRYNAAMAAYGVLIVGGGLFLKYV